ncbi:hypothetical protein BJ322DRAFT_1005044 [Thelephora terrestris]|uniref:Uncharacterized protein n=1 Tax=Thelephora terrestris TaxID=56493 RepID=A0A9P6L7I8_9AGAM|nr:hypothetical protein BJ322DRAFT_1005044 [Thelephora terrestris]
MLDKVVGRPWSTEEDNLLIQAVAIHGQNDNWKQVATAVPGRTNKACRKRWLHSLCPTVKKTAWTREEDELLLSLYAIHSTKWSVIARHIPGRTDDACSKRYREALDPSLKKGDWSPEEDFHLLQAYKRLGGRWGQIGAELCRSGLGCRNRWRLLNRKNMTSDPSLEQSTSNLPGTSTGWAEISLLPQNIWHNSQAMRFSGSGHIPTTVQCTDRPMGVSSSSAPMFQYASSSLCCALSPSDSSPNPTTMHLQPNGAPRYLIGNCCRPAMDHGSTPMEIDYDSVNQDHHPADPARESISSVADVPPNSTGTQCSVGWSVPQNPANELSSEDLSIPNNAHSHADLPNPGFQVPCVASTLPASIPPMSSVQGVTEVDHAPGSAIPETLVLEEATAPLPPSNSDPPNSTKSKRGRPGTNYKLSSSLPVTLDKTLAYACGHEDCWPSDTPTGSVSFATSKELSDHSKNDHNESMGGTKPYRCALDRCGKGWKSINGLQYHLQVSKAHFSQALLDQFSREQKNKLERSKNSSSISGGDAVGEDQGTKRKKHPCPHDGCPNIYRQKSGLRYHLSHVSSSDKISSSP